MSSLQRDVDDVRSTLETLKHQNKSLKKYLAAIWKSCKNKINGSAEIQDIKAEQKGNSKISKTKSGKKEFFTLNLLPLQEKLKAIVLRRQGWKKLN